MELVYTQEEIPEIAKKIIQESSVNILAFYAPMGAGKTTLITAIMKELGSGDEASSPTFGLVNEYETKGGKLLGYHFDFYRLNNEIEALDMGLEDYLNTDAWIFMEWPEKISNLLPTAITKIYIEILSPTKRRLTID